MSLMSPYTPVEVYRTAIVAVPGFGAAPTLELPLAPASASAPAPAAETSNRLIEVDWSRAPSPFLKNLFHLLVFHHAEEKCQKCYRPYYWILMSKQARSIRLVCKQWRQVFLQSLILPTHRARLYVCPSPLTCLKIVEMRLAEQQKKFKRFYIPYKKSPI